MNSTTPPDELMAQWWEDGLRAAIAKRGARLPGRSFMACQHVATKACERQRQKDVSMLDLSADQIRLMCGEVTAQEMRTVQAVLSTIKSKMEGS